MAIWNLLKPDTDCVVIGVIQCQNGEYYAQRVEVLAGGLDNFFAEDEQNNECWLVSWGIFYRIPMSNTYDGWVPIAVTPQWWDKYHYQYFDPKYLTPLKEPYV